MVVLTHQAELFEKLYLTPQTRVKGDLRSTFGNPTPVALIGFLLSCSPLACELMGWRGAGGSGAATLGAYYFIVSIRLLSSRVWCWTNACSNDEGIGKSLRLTLAIPQGGLLMTLGGILEFVLGNTFAFVVFCSFGQRNPTVSLSSHC